MASYLTPLPLCEEFASGVHSQCCYTLLQLRYLPISLIRIKEIQIGDHEIKTVNFANDTTIFLKEITCFNRKQLILKLWSQFFIKIFGVNFGNSILDNSNRDKISEGIKNSISGTDRDSP